MATKRPKKREEFDLVEHLTRSIGEMMREMGLRNHDELVVESPEVAREYHIKGIYSIMADSDSCACHGLMPYYVVYAYNKYVDRYNRLHYLKG